MALIGIARLAAESPLLEAKRAVEYFEIPARSILNRTKPTMPFQFTINPYRGCEIGCKYCYARYAHDYMELSAQSFEEKIYAKATPGYLLKQELAKIDKRNRIALGTATDPYQPAERRYRRTRTILEVFANERGWHLGITTKSDLVTRDIDLLREIARRNILWIHMTVTTVDERLARLLEPRAPRPELRLQAVSKLREANVCVAVFPSPVMPGINDTEKSLDAVAQAAKAAGATSFSGGPLFLPGPSQAIFLPFVEREFPDLASRYREAFDKSIYLSKGYKDALAEKIRRIRERHQLTSGMTDYRPELWVDDEQMDLFSADTPAATIE